MASAQGAPQPQQLGPPNSARLALTSLCKILWQYGVGVLDPETVRQAKFDGPVAAPMWRALHDTVLLLLAGRGTGGPAGAGGAGGGRGCALEPAAAAAAAAALGRQWEAVSHELLDVSLGAPLGAAGSSFPAEGAALVVRQLAAWGAPPALLAALRPPGAAAGAVRHMHPHSYSQEDRAGGGAGSSGNGVAAKWGDPGAWRSRPLLLALGWLVAAARLFERRIAELEPGPEARALLPPYPPDSCLGATTQAVYDAAAQEARQLVSRSLISLSAPVGGGGVGAQAGAPRGAAGLRARPPPGDPFGPSAAAASREALWGDVEAAAQRAVMLCGRARGRRVTLQAAMDCRHRLTASLAARQAAASPSSRPLTPYELQLAAQPAAVQRHAAALESATLALLEQQELAAHGALFFDWLGSVVEEEEAAQQGGGAKGRGRAQAAGAAASSAAASSLSHLPHVGSEAAGRLQEQLEAQLAAAVQAAAPELSAARQRAAQGGAGASRAAAAAGAAVSIQHFLALAERAVSEQPAPGPGGDALGSASGASGAASAMGAGLLMTHGDGSPAPWSADLGRDAGPWRLPDDVASGLSAVQVAAAERAGAEAEAEAQLALLRHGAFARCDFSGGPNGTGAGGPLAAVLAGGGPAGGGGGGVAAGAETQRLLEAVLGVARPLARARAGHKAALRAALQELPEGYLVAGV
ncbi:hypothetical protein HXX76_000875 [Chlamydomonas incerta]|uniref:Uncharacterized protein n=1 Tax=Chlamydomonas incerta TaxID=51695 RepID=A0A836B337_CHLIN|nr:hypothetical protein HXX76_000875 [Chlamydomonas incerta]|eukprot:KAG2446286.1 hypothetical protein HXX76_000875 [Chlamydomonas incerta]